jgi:RNA methyltransferase, TrmH family
MVQAAKHRPQNKKELDRNALITSRDNRWLKRFRAALAGERDEEGMVAVEGVRMVEAGLQSGLAVAVVLVSESGGRYLARLAPSISRELQILRTTDRLFAGVADTLAPQGVAALVRPRKAEFEDVLKGVALVVLLVGVQDPGNVGTILRAAEAFGATGAAVCPAGLAGTANPLGPKALRASAGSSLRLPILQEKDCTALLARFRISGVKAYAAVPDSDGDPAGAAPVVRPWEADWKSPVALLIGNEGTGLPAEIVRSCDARLSIPQSGSQGGNGPESLNAAMAGTVLLYEAMRQRGGGIQVTKTNSRI